MACYDSSLKLFSSELSAVRREIAVADSWALGKGASISLFPAYIKAFSYVWIAAALEEFVRTTIQALFLELSSLSVKCVEIKPSLLAVYNFSSYDALRDVSGLKMWETRVNLENKSASNDIVSFSNTVLPLDGRTLRFEHFRILWSVFDFPGKPIPTPLHSLALKDLADGRNDIAHGHADPISFGRKKVTSDILRLIDRVEDIGLGVVITIDDYLNKKIFLR